MSDDTDARSGGDDDGDGEAIDGREGGSGDTDTDGDHTTALDPDGRFDGAALNTVSGVAFEPLAPAPGDVRLDDVAHGLAHGARFVGQSRDFYSVAQHSLNVSRAMAADGAGAREQLYGLLHDASEAYLADVPGMVKPAFEGYLDAENAVMEAVWAWSGLGPPPGWDSGAGAGGDRTPYAAADAGVLQVEGDRLLVDFEPDPRSLDRYADAVDVAPRSDFGGLRAEFADRARRLAADCGTTLGDGR